MQEFDRRFVDGCAIFFNSTKFVVIRILIICLSYIQA